MNGCPAILSVALRATSAFGKTANPTDPLPCPDPPLKVIQPTVEEVGQEHESALAVTAIDPLPPVDATFCDVGEMENVHAGAGAASCCSVTRCPSIVTVAVRG